jgi:hypothetical protein
MQIQAILEAAACAPRRASRSIPEIMVPQVATVEELKRIHGYVQRIHKVVELTHGINVGSSSAACWKWCVPACAPGAWPKTPSSSASAPTT